MSNSNTAQNDIARKLASLSASVVCDAGAGQGVLAPGLIRFSGSGTVAGRVVTADCDEGSLRAIFAALDHAQPGDILCTTAPGSSAYLGDLLAADIVNRGLAAAVVDGMIRDRDQIASLPVSFFARGTTPVARRGSAPGRSMVPITIGGVQVNPGDWIVADSDGIVAIPPEKIETVLEQADENARIEERIMARIKAGAKVLDAVKQELGG